MYKELFLLYLKDENPTLNKNNLDTIKIIFVDFSRFSYNLLFLRGKQELQYFFFEINTQNKNIITLSSTLAVFKTSNATS